MQAVPLHLREANEFVSRFHRHSLPTVGGKFALGAAGDSGTLVGVAVAGRPVARRLDDGRTLEVLRVCTDGTPNACSFLYARVARIARMMGYVRVITYTLASEGGASLRAVGATPTGPLGSHEWGNPSRPRRSQAVYHEPKYRWELLPPGSHGDAPDVRPPSEGGEITAAPRPDGGPQPRCGGGGPG